MECSPANAGLYHTTPHQFTTHTGGAICTDCVGCTDDGCHKMNLYLHTTDILFSFFCRSTASWTGPGWMDDCVPTYPRCRPMADLLEHTNELSKMMKVGALRVGVR